MGIKWFGIADWTDRLKEKNFLLGELVKQAIDQPLHVAMMFASVWTVAAITHGLSLWLTGTAIGVEWSTAVGVVVTAAWNFVREYLQWPSKRWWDPYLDWIFEAGGIALGGWTWVLLLAKLTS